MKVVPKILLLFAFTGNAFSQTASLTGLVSDALSSSPLGGVSIVVGAKTSGVSGPDGHYVVPGLAQGAEVTLTFDKGGYGKYVATVRVAGPKLVRNVELLKETADAAYWSAWSQKRLAASNPTQHAIVASAWHEVESGGLSVEAKSVAARSLLATKPAKNEAPESMLAAAGASRFQERTDRGDVGRSTLAADRQWEGAVQQKEATRERLLAQLNEILQTRDSARGVVVSMSDVLFDSGRYSLKPSARERLTKVVDILRAYPGLNIEVTGYTDNAGGDEKNQVLSERRAEAVREYLLSQGVTNSITARGFGSSLPEASNDSSSGRQQNRRVELVLSGDAIDNP